MKIWKKLCVSMLLLCMLLCVMSVTVAADNTHTHPVCGATHTDIGDHTGSCAAVVWTAWDGTSDINYGESNTAYVYLSDNATRSSTFTVTGGNTLYLCLGGKTLTGDITVEGDATLNICDCRGGGEIKTASGNAVYVKTKSRSNVHTTLNLYGGKIGSDSTFNSGAIELYNNDRNNAQTVAVFNMYGGEVYNGGAGEAAVFASYANIGQGYYELNMYGGSIRCEKGNGFAFSNNENVTMQITGGTITSGNYGVNLSSNDKLTLSGNPQFIDKKYYSSSAGIYIPNGVTLTVTDDFAPAGGTTVSVGMFIDDATGTAVIATPASGKSLSAKAQYFTSAVEGCFVECNADGNLYLTKCAITGQPTKGNRYTVSANGTPDYQWWSTKRGDVTVTDERATADTFYYAEWREEWYYSTEASDGTAVTLKAFTLHMAAGDVLKLNSVRDIDSSYFYLTGVSITRSGGGSTPLTGTYDDYTFTAPADGEYTVEITAEWAVGSSSYYMNFSFTATVSDDVTDAELSGQTDKTLDTTALENGKYICAVTWGNTTLYSDVAEVHNHTWNDGEVTTAPTCTVAGVKTFTCTECSATNVQTIDALGHDFTGAWQKDTDNHWKQCSHSGCTATDGKAAHRWAEQTILEATCTADGKKLCICKDCLAAKSETLPATGHTLTHHAEKAPTCTEIGWNAYDTCACGYTTYVELPALGHDRIHHNAKAVTCTEKGWEAYETCSRCAYTTYAELPALGHTTISHEAKAATCVNIGWNAYDTCSRCDYTTFAELPALGHDKIAHEGQAATCVNIGWNAYDTCSRCAYTTYAELPALGHTTISHDAKAATCTEKGWRAYVTCEHCGYTTYVELPALGHDFTGAWQKDDNNHWKQCSRCTATDGKAAHRQSAGDVLAKASCTADGKKLYICEDCFATKSETLPATGHTLTHHEARAATCTEKGWNAYDTCETCGYTSYAEIGSLGHDFGDAWKSDAAKHWKECSRCDAVAERASHTGGTATCHDSAVCTVCETSYGERNPDYHTGGSEIRDMTAPTAEKAGHTGNRYCKGCNAKLSEGTGIPTLSDLSLDQKSDLTAATEAMEKILDDWYSDFTEEQKELLTDRIRATKSALASIEKAEEVVKKAEALPAADKTRPDDKSAMDAYDAAKNAYDALSDAEKELAGERTKSALDAMWKALTAYDVIDGNGSTWANTDNEGLTFTVNGHHEKFAGLLINGATVDPKYYEIQAGSTVITLKAEYLQTLSAGKYTVTVRYTDGSTDGEDSFTVTENKTVAPSDPAASSDPDAADGTATHRGVVVGIILAIICALLLLFLLLFFKKRRKEEK